LGADQVGAPLGEPLDRHAPSGARLRGNGGASGAAYWLRHPARSGRGSRNHSAPPPGRRSTGCRLSGPRVGAYSLRSSPFTLSRCRS